MKDEKALEVRPLVRWTGKAPDEIRRRDLVNLCLERGIRVVNLRYASGDGKLRELRVPVRSRAALDRLLAVGERVDGSSLFPGLFSTGSSDLYAVPVYRWAFPNPFMADELDIVCRFVDRSGRPAGETPDNVLAAACQRIRERHDLDLTGLAELEFYLILDREDSRFAGKAQRSYHQSSPYIRGRAIVDEILRKAVEIVGAVKYAHAEVGYIDRLGSEMPELDGRRVEQYELELDSMPMEDLGCWLSVTRWLVRAVAARHGASATFVPKLDEGMAGSGMHLHLGLDREGRSVLREDEGGLSREALSLIGGLLGAAPVLAAFGNTVASSYLRLVPGQEAPTRISWGKGDRTGLIRIPLDFGAPHRLDRAVNPDEDGDLPSDLLRPTVELRSPDGSAFPHLLLGAVALAVDEGLTEGAGLARARALRLAPGEEPREGAARLPLSVAESAEILRRDRLLLEKRGFPSRWIDLVADRLDAERDRGLAERIGRLPTEERLREIRRLMHKDLHKH